MKTDSRQHMSTGSRLRFGLRLLGISGLLAALAGALCLASVLPEWRLDALLDAVQDKLGRVAMVGAFLLAGGAILAVLALLVEIANVFSGASGQRGAAEANTVVQIVLAAALLVAVNVYAFRHEANRDLTRNKQFTLPYRVVSQLQKLNCETTIVVLQQHKTFGRLSEKPDRFDYAAERKVVEKVQDTVDLFRKFGAQFKIVVLDVEQEGYDKKLKEVTHDHPALSESIRTAPENSILFYSEGRVQRMSFNEFYLLDKSASKKEGDNLVLQPQGLDGFVKRIIAVQEKRPKVALVAMHNALSSESEEAQDIISLAGMKKALLENGFDVTDLILKQNWRPAEQFDGDPAAYSLDESKLQHAEEDFADADTSVRVFQANLKNWQKIQDRCAAVKDEPPKKRFAVYREFAEEVTDEPFPRDLTELTERQEGTYLTVLAIRLDQARHDLTESTQARDEAKKKLDLLRQRERAIEDRLLVDVKAKLARLLDDCDLIVVPRITILNATNARERLPYGVHKMKAVHIDAIKEFMKAGKPVLVCTGPVNETINEGKPPAVFDDFEELLKDRGIKLGGQTILFDKERKAFTAQSAGSMMGGSDVPPVSFDPPNPLPPGKAPNPLEQIMRSLERSIDDKLNIKLRAPRPVYVSDETQANLPFAAGFMWTDPSCWNETFPFAEFRRVPTSIGIITEPVYIPRFNPLPSLDKKTKDQERERRGPFQIGVAIESTAPASWYEKKRAPFDPLDEPKTEEPAKKPADARTSRLVVIGQGGVFAGAQLKPGTERLLVNTCNWLLVRDDRLAQESDRPWRYPRVEMSAGRKEMWHWGAFLGLPACFIYIGLVVLMIRRIR